MRWMEETSRLHVLWSGLEKEDGLTRLTFSNGDGSTKSFFVEPRASYEPYRTIVSHKLGHVRKTRRFASMAPDDGVYVAVYRDITLGRFSSFKEAQEKVEVLAKLRGDK